MIYENTVIFILVLTAVYTVGAIVAYDVILDKDNHTDLFKWFRDIMCICFWPVFLSIVLVLFALVVLSFPFVYMYQILKK